MPKSGSLIQTRQYVLKESFYLKSLCLFSNTIVSQLFLTSVLFNSPRLRFSRAQQKAILSWARELGASSPSYYAYNKFESVLGDELGSPTRREVSGQGNVWYLNEIGDSIKKVCSPLLDQQGLISFSDNTAF